MDLDLAEEQRALAGLAREIFAGSATQERLREVEAGPDRFDRALWEELANADLLGVAIPAEDGGSGGGLLELCILLEEQGRAVVPVPLWPCLVLGALPVAAFGGGEQRARRLPGIAAGAMILTGALPPDGASPTVEERRGRLNGVVPMVPAAHLASWMVVDAEPGLFLVDARTASLTSQTLTGGEPAFEVSLDAVPAEPLRAGTHDWVLERALVGLCALQVGVCERALHLTAEYLSGREQFGRPLGSFQAVQQRAADAYIDIEAMRWTMWQAAWRLDAGLPASEEVAIAKFWAADGGARVTAAAQHLHGGIGVDVEYPLHRYTLWAKRIELVLGSAAHQIARLGAMMAG